jgi:hypothetical protein
MISELQRIRERPISRYWYMGRTEKNYENLSQKSWCPSQNVKYKQAITADIYYYYYYWYET